MASPLEQDQLISTLCGIMGIAPSAARELLEDNGWDLDSAIAEVCDDQTPELEYEGTRGTQQPAAQQPASAPVPKPVTGKRRFATLGDLSPSPSLSPRNPDDEPQNFFTGGEKSGLAVHDPEEIKRQIIKQGRETPPSQWKEEHPSYFKGTARTLGGDDAPSKVIEDPNARRPPRDPTMRILHFWNDGFSVDDGDLYRTSDPKNARLLEYIREGSAPLSIMNVLPDQEVDVKLVQHDTDYIRPQGKFKAFAGSGQRLGSPTPGVEASRPAAAAAPTSAPAQGSTGPEQPSVDESQPTVTLQIRLGDGTRLIRRFNTTHTIGDVYQFVAAASPASQQRQWVLMTTFPSVELKDHSATLGDLPEYKRGGVVVQKWT